ncbi:MAG TPA: glycosyltransferase [Candidatus Polarisedimenticolia bacterium]|nr:glycosyltransferase [Candidatus Polarisedimenticolia bacterium]
MTHERMPSGEGMAIVVVPRDRFSMFARCLDAIEARTPPPFRVVAVAGGADPATRSYLEGLRTMRPHVTALLPDRLLEQSESRNLALRQVRERFVVVLENDTIVQEGWLPPLLECLREERAAAVAPLLWWYRGLHAAGGSFEERDQDGAVAFDYRINYSGIRRRRIDYPENHCVLIDRERLADFEFDEVEPFDVDLGLTLRQRGLSAFLEPRSLAHYEAPPPLERRDLPPFRLRWDWTAWERSNLRFERKWGFVYDRACKRASYRRQRLKFGLAARYPNALTLAAANLAFGATNRLQAAVAHRRWLRSGAARLFRLHATE